jgi:adenylate cyclase
LFRETIDTDPDFALAYAMLAWTYWFDFSNAWTDEPDESLESASRIAQQAIELDDSLPIAHFVKGLVHRERKEYAAALAEAEQTIRVDPNYANGRVLLATVLYYTGRPTEGLEQIKEAMRLEPHHLHNYPFHEGQAYFILGRHDDAIRTFKQGLSMNPTSQRLRLWLAASYAQADRIDDAKWELEQVLVMDPDLSLSRIEKAYPFRYSADMENFLAALARAGLQ